LQGVRLTADGEVVAHPRPERTAKQARNKAQKHGARPKQGRHRRAKAVRGCAKQPPPVRRHRRAFHHKTALALVRQDAIISVAAPPPAHLSRQCRPQPKPEGTGGSAHHGAARKGARTKRIQDAGWSSFLSIRACKPAGAGKRVAASPPADTSPECSTVRAEGPVCGERSAKSLSVRPPICLTSGSGAD